MENMYLRLMHQNYLTFHSFEGFAGIFSSRSFGRFCWANMEYLYTSVWYKKRIRRMRFKDWRPLLYHKLLWRCWISSRVSCCSIKNRSYASFSKKNFLFIQYLWKVRCKMTILAQFAISFCTCWMKYCISTTCETKWKTTSRAFLHSLVISHFISLVVWYTIIYLLLSMRDVNIKCIASLKSHPSFSYEIGNDKESIVVMEIVPITPLFVFCIIWLNLCSFLYYCRFCQRIKALLWVKYQNVGLV